MVDVKNQEWFKSLVLNGDDILVEWYTTWCGPCKMLAPIVDSIETLFPEIRFVKIDAEAQLELSKIYSVSSVPTLMRFKGGKIVFRAAGFKSKDAVIKLLTD